MTLRECAEALGTPIRRLPLWAYRALAKLFWRLRLSEAPPGQIDFALYPWIVGNEKLKRTTGWSPRYTSRETFEITMRAHGKLPPAEAPPGRSTTATLAA
jgi:UDP-glucose 4-epimerase